VIRPEWTFYPEICLRMLDRRLHEASLVESRGKQQKLLHSVKVPDGIRII